METIYHISDLHFSNKNSNNYEEYMQIQKQLISHISQDQTNKILVITGDLTNEGDRSTSRNRLVLLNFLITMSKYCEILLIAGNHDINMKNLSKDQVDVLEELLMMRGDHQCLKHEITYAKTSTTFLRKGVYFYIHSLLDNNNDNLSYKPKQPSVLLYHGAIQSDKLNHYYSNTATLPESYINKFDLVLLGDYHSHTFIKPNMAYSGSIISLNHGEAYPHGFIK